MTFQPPIGFIPFGSLVDELYRRAEEWGATLPVPVAVMNSPLHGRAPTAETRARRFEPFIAPQLATGTLRAVGSHKNDGELMWAPSATWRVSLDDPRGRGRHVHYGFSPSQVSAVLCALLNGPVPFQPSGYRSYVCYPMLSARDLALAFGATNPPPPPSPPLVIRDLERKAPAPEPMLPASEPEPVLKRTGGRLPQYDWDAFWIEVACWAAKNDLLPQHERRPALRKHVLDWFALQDTKPPDDSMIRAKLAALFARATRET